MSLSLLSTFTSSSSFSRHQHQNSLRTICALVPKRPPLLRTSNCKHNQFGEEEEESENNCVRITPRRSALIALGVLTGFSATLFDQALMATGSPSNGSSKPAMLPEFGSQPRPLNSVIRVLVPRPPKPQNQVEEDENVEILVVNGIQVQNNKPVKFDVYIAKPDGDELGSDELGELAGSLVNLASLRLERKKLQKLGLNLGIDWLLEEIGAVNSEKLVVSLVPRFGDVVIGGMHIEYIKAA